MRGAAGRSPALSAAALECWRASGEELTLTVTGRSMVPNLLPGQRVCIRSAAAGELRSGDILAFIDDPGGVVVHRFVELRHRGGITQICQKGDALLGWRWVDAKQVLGVVTAVEGRLGRRDLNARTWRLYNRLWGQAARLLVSLGEALGRRR